MWINAHSYSVYTLKTILFLVICSIIPKDSHLLPNYATFGRNHSCNWDSHFPNKPLIDGLVKAICELKIATRLCVCK